MTKGSGMIQPRMATTLGFILTDAVLSTRRAEDILDVAVNRSYNRISVDGDTSTNDTLVLLANGASGFEAKPRSATPWKPRCVKWPRAWRGRSPRMVRGRAS